MGLTVSHALSATTPDDPAYEIKPSNWNADHAITFVPDSSEVIKWVSAGAESVSSGTVVFGNSNGVSFGMSNGTITATVNPGAAAGIAAFGAGTQTATSGTVVFANSNGITAGMSGSSQVTFSHNGLTTQTVQTQNMVSVLGSTGNISFANGNGITFGANASTITASHNGITSQSAQTQNVVVPSAGTQTATSGTVVFSNNAAITFGMSNNSVITATHNGLTTAMQSQSSSVFARTGFTSTTQAGTAVSATLNTNGLSMAVPAFLTTAALSQNTSNYAGLGTTFNGANISGSMTMNTNGLQLSMSVAAPGGGGGAAISAGANSTNAGTVVFSNSNGVSFGMDGAGVITATVVPGAAAGIAAVQAGAQTQTSGTLVFANSNGITFGMSGSSQVTASYSVPASSSLHPGNGIYISTAGSTISIGDEYKSYWQNVLYVQGTSTQSVGQSTSVVFPIQPNHYLSLGYMRMQHTVSLASTSFASTANTQYSYQQAETHNWVIYSRGTGASSQSLVSMISTSVGLTYSINVSQNTTTNFSVSHGITYPMSSGTASTSFSFAASNASVQISTTHMTRMSGMKFWDTQFATTLGEGPYWMVYGISTAQTTQQTAILSGNRLLHSHWGVTQPNVTMAEFGAPTNASIQMMHGLGSFTTNAIATTSGFDISKVSSRASHVMPLITFARIA